MFNFTQRVEAVMEPFLWLGLLAASVILAGKWFGKRFDREARVWIDIGTRSFVTLIVVRFLFSLT